MPGILTASDVLLAAGADMATFGSGLTCSAVIRSRFKAVPSGTQLTSVRIGLSVG
ncbi:hypothetical protein D3C87_2166510 [compost metagenome]